MSNNIMKYFILKEVINQDYYDGFVEGSTVETVNIQDITSEDATAILSSLMSKLDDDSFKKIEKKFDKDFRIRNALFKMWGETMEKMIKQINSILRKGSNVEIYESSGSSGFLHIHNHASFEGNLESFVEELTGKRAGDLKDYILGKRSLFIKINFEELAKNYPSMKKKVSEIKKKEEERKTKAKASAEKRKKAKAKKQLEEARKVLRASGENV